LTPWDSCPAFPVKHQDDQRQPSTENTWRILDRGRGLHIELNACATDAIPHFADILYLFARLEPSTARIASHWRQIDEHGRRKVFFVNRFHGTQKIPRIVDFSTQIQMRYSAFDLVSQENRGCIA